MTDATSPRSTKSRNLNSLVHIQIRPKSQIESLPRDTEESEFLDTVDVGDVVLSVGNVIGCDYD